MAFHITVFPPSLPGHRASPTLPGSSTWTLVLQVSGSPFGAGTPPTLHSHPSSISQSGTADVASKIPSPESPLKALLSSGTLSLLS